MLLGTLPLMQATIIKSLVSIPREDSCFWERGVLRRTGLAGVVFQSPERIHAFGNTVGQRVIVDRRVSIPREDSCFWEQTVYTKQPVQKSFQSPERIHAFGNSSG